jgi:hypothetical protein
MDHRVQGDRHGGSAAAEHHPRGSQAQHRRFEDLHRSRLTGPPADGNVGCPWLATDGRYMIEVLEGRATHIYRASGEEED